MTLKKAIEILEIHQKWRRGADIPMRDAKELGIAIDLIIKTLKK